MECAIPSNKSNVPVVVIYIKTSRKSKCTIMTHNKLLKLEKIYVSLILTITFFPSVQSVQSLNSVWLFVTPWTAAHQASLSITNSRSLLKLMSIESVMPSNHLILCHPLLLPSIFLSIRVFSIESALWFRWPRYWSFSISNIYILWL